MKQSKLLLPTLREVPADIQSESHQLLVKSGFIRQTASGFYSYLPLAVYVLEKIKKIIQKELETVDAVEVMAPHIVPLELLDKTERKELFKNDLFSFNDHTERGYALVPTSEEVFADLVFSEGQSYRRFPYHLYQIQTKFRDESKIRHGLIRAREFLMADIYSFHATEEDLNQSYFSYEKIFKEVFEKCSVAFASVVGDNGIMGGKESKEFVAFSEIGDETIVSSTEGDYVSDYTLAKRLVVEKKSHEPLEELVSSPLKSRGKYARTQISEDKELTLYHYLLEDQEVWFLLPINRKINETKIKNYFNVRKITQKKETDNFFAALKKKEKPKVYTNEEIFNQMNYTIVDEIKQEIYLNVNPHRDFEVLETEDFLYVKEGDVAPSGKGTLAFKTGVEIGHIFKLGDFYSKKLGGSFVDENENRRDILMGSYGIGISRLLQIIVQQHHDENGITWPKAVSPFDLHIIPVNLNEESQFQLLEEILTSLKTTDYTYLVDDRNEHVGVKFADADLIGCVLRLTIGKKASEGIIEVSLRQSGEKVEVKKEDLIDILPILYASAF